MSYRIWRSYAYCSIDWTDDEPDEGMTFRTFREAKARLLFMLKEGRDELNSAMSYVRQMRAKDVERL